MAKKIGTRQQRDAAGAANATPSDTEVLHPERVLQLAGRAVTMREYGHIEWLRLLPRAKPLIDSIASRLETAARLETGKPPSYEDALEVMAEHVDALMPLVHQACDLEPDAVLSPDEGEMLLMAWWGCNGRFFVQRAMTRIMVGLHETARAPQATEKSTSPSSP